jgi:hypothetical protein
MDRSDQTDGSAGQPQLDMFGAPPAQNYDPDPESVRAELNGILARARAAPTEPWLATACVIDENASHQ